MARTQQAMPQYTIQSPLARLLSQIEVDEQDRTTEENRINNIRALRLAFMNALQSAGLKGRSLDIQELRAMK